jgi:hypothetical protein
LRSLDNQIVEIHHAVKDPEERETLFIARIDYDHTSLSIHLDVIDAEVIDLIRIE